MGVKGFTMMEILAVIVVLAVIAGLAVPVYTSTIESSRANEAKTNLNAIYMGEKIYAINNGGNYWNAGGTTINDINTNLNLDINADYYTDGITVTANNGANPKTFSASLTRQSGTDTYTIDQTGVITGP